MIWESQYWKEPLLEMADRIESLKTTTEISDEEYVQLEKDILIGFYSIRKLIDTPTKITDKTKTMLTQVDWYPAIKEVNWRNNHKVDQLFDFSNGGKEKRDLAFVCGKIIHSFILSPVINEGGGLDGTLFTSDYDKNEKIYFIGSDTIIDIFRKIGIDYPTEIKYSKNPIDLSETTVVK